MKENNINVLGKMDDVERRSLETKVSAELSGSLESITEYARKLELPKSEEDLRVIERINNWLNDYVEAIGVNQSQINIKPDNIIILSDDDFLKVGRECFNSDWSFYAGKMLSGSDIMLIKKLPEKEKFAALVGLVHESFHIGSKFEIRVFKSAEDSEDFNASSVRTGFSIRSIKEASSTKEEEVFEYFDGLNEAVVQMMALDLLDRHSNELENDFNITPEEQKGFKYKDGYGGFRYILLVIMKELADGGGLSMKEYWLNFRKSLFSGKLMFLRDVERQFGKGSLRVLAFLGSHSEHAQDMDLIKLFEQYFLSKDQATRLKIAEEIFDKEGDEKYLEKYKKLLANRAKS